MSSSRIKHCLKYFTACAGLYKLNRHFSTIMGGQITNVKVMQNSLTGRYGLKHKTWWLSPLTRKDWIPARVWWEVASDWGALWGGWGFVVVRLHCWEQQHLLWNNNYKYQKVYFPSIIMLVSYASVRTNNKPTGLCFKGCITVLTTEQNIWANSGGPVLPSTCNHRSVSF